MNATSCLSNRFVFRLLLRGAFAAAILALWGAMPSLFQRAVGDEPAKVVIHEDFQSGASRWSPTDETKWKVDKLDSGNQVYHLLGVSKYQPPHRSPHSISLLKDVVVGDFEFTAKVQTLQSSRGHRDMCVIFGYQDPANFYYVHLGQATDDHANQIFVVDDAPRIKISEKTTTGTPWKDATWHTVKIVRRVSEGTIEIYFDDLAKPAMIAHDKRFAWGQIGLGSFDDMGMWDDVHIIGIKHSPTNKNR